MTPREKRYHSSRSYKKKIRFQIINCGDIKFDDCIKEYDCPKPFPSKFIWDCFNEYKEREQQKRMFKMLMAPTAIQVHAPHYFLGSLNSDL